MKSRHVTRRVRPVLWAIGAAAVLWAGTVFAVGATGLRPAWRPAAVGGQQDDRAAKAFTKVCNDCHEPDRIVETHRTRGGWEEIIEKMIEKGATGSDQDFDFVLQYLLSHYGMVNMNQAPPEEIALVVGLSPKEADAIVAFRRANGNFKNFDALAKVPDVDQKKIEEHKNYLLF